MCAKRLPHDDIACSIADDLNEGEPVDYHFITTFCEMQIYTIDFISSGDIFHLAFNNHVRISLHRD
jgi:hypothetical protein